MKSLVVFAAVVLACQAAKVPPEVNPQIVATPPTSSTKIEIPAQVGKVTKDYVSSANMQAVVMSTMQPETKTILPFKVDMTTDTSVADGMKRKTRAVPFTDNEKLKSPTPHHNIMNMMKSMGPQKKHSMLNNMPKHRAMRSLKLKTTTEVPMTGQPVTNSESPAIKSSIPSSNDSCDLLCTKFEFEPICASNDLCLHEFPNQCILETYNCKHPGGKFSATKDGSCQMAWLTKCEESDMI